MHCPPCHVGCVAIPEDFTCPVSLGDTGQFDCTSRSIHLVLPHWTGQVDWVPEAFTCPVSLDRPGRLDFLRTCLFRWSD